MHHSAAQRAGKGACDSAAFQGTGGAPVLLYLYPGRERPWAPAAEPGAGYSPGWLSDTPWGIKGPLGRAVLGVADRAAGTGLVLGSCRAWVRL